jgi:hypothetical protein
VQRELLVAIGSLLDVRSSVSQKSFAASEAALRWKAHINLGDSYIRSSNTR